MRMREAVTMCGACILAGAVHAQVEITALDSKGRMTWAVPSGAVSTVEWRSSLTGAGEWRDSWHGLHGILSTQSTTTADVPMFYRVTSYTNGLYVRMCPGQRSASVASNDAAEVWTQRTLIVGSAYVPSTSNHYAISSGYPRDPQIEFIRSTGNSVHMLTWGTGSNYTDIVLFRDASVGTSWTNVYGGYDDNGTWSISPMVHKIIAVEDVTVPAGTFNATCMAIVDTNQPPNTNSVGWFVRGVGVVKWHQYDTEPPNEISELLTIPE